MHWMDDFVIGPAIMLLLAAIFLIIFFTIDSAVIGRKLRRHQKEWGKIKSRIPIEIVLSAENGKIKAEISARKRYDAYMRYCNILWCIDGGSFSGACFPSYGEIKNERTLLFYDANVSDEHALRAVKEYLISDLGDGYVRFINQIILEPQE